MKELLSLNKFLWKYRWELIAGFVMIILSNFVSIFSINYVGNAIDGIESLLTKFKSGEASELSEVKKGLMNAALLFIGLKVLAGLLLVGVRLMIIATSRHIEYDLKNDIYEHYQKLSLSFYKKNKTGDLMNRITEDVAFVRQYLGPGIMYPMDLISRATIILAFMINIDPLLTLYTLGPLPILSFLIYKVASTINKKSTEVQKQQSNISSIVQDTFSGIRVIKSFNTENSTQENYAKEAELYEKKALSLAQTEAFFFPLMVLIVGISNLLILYMGGVRYAEGKLSIGVIAQFFMYLNMLIWPFTSLGWVTMLIQRAEASMTRINEFLKQKPEIQNAVEHETPIEGKIEFKNVSYTYENTGIEALKNLSFTIEKGKSLAIMGKTGSGKSTVVLLLARLLQPTSGQILIDGVPYENLNLKSLRKAIGFVPQEAFLFSDTIQQNILFGAEDGKNLDDAKNFAKKAAVHQNVEGFKDRYDTILGERGVTLSGGQKQRISIARALIKEPEILVFDDSLSAVDTETEEEILRNLKSEMNQKTTLIVTHRISSAKNADEILVLDDGQKIELGSHSDLVAKEGAYFSLVKKQLIETENL
ncbi:ABC transporter ATP-binding protein [Moheibacter lacus]|uniref:ABC transporter ATP-binding protein n=1 Tax=Moheibacter lacus TaxID=2745851 RepID=A0A838ZJD9_9FLAO|nr:ABC transporter ATP-binding protein [Moheibacter lacus]MBA5628474.1 ABC transporter ATP-binding protein [Moheibacter lacus]